MRKTKQSPEDEALRLALQNMRYTACTPSDIKFLNSRVITLNPALPNLSHPEFRNVSIITPLNIQKNRFNEWACKQFVSESNQTLSCFFLVNTDSQDADLPINIQQAVWRLPANETSQIPGKLFLQKNASYDSL